MSASESGTNHFLWESTIDTFYRDPGSAVRTWLFGTVFLLRLKTIVATHRGLRWNRSCLLRAVGTRKLCTCQSHSQGCKQCSLSWSGCQSEAWSLVPPARFLRWGLCLPEAWCEQYRFCPCFFTGGPGRLGHCSWCDRSQQEMELQSARTGGKAGCLYSWLTGRMA